MTQIAAIAYAFLKGEIISIKTAFDMFGCSNAPREVSRSIEQKFGVKISRNKVNFKSRYGKTGIYFQYRLNRDATYNQDGIAKMKAYVKEEMKNDSYNTEKIIKSKYNQPALF